MGRIRNIVINTGVKGSPQTSIYEYVTDNTISVIQDTQRTDKKYELVVENGTYISQNLDYVEAKMEKYLLNLKHDKGASKAKFLKETLGYESGDGPILHNNIRKALIGTTPTKVTPTPDGVKQEYNLMLQSKTGKMVSAKVVLIVQKDNGKTTYRIITMYPGKKEK